MVPPKRNITFCQIFLKNYFILSIYHMKSDYEYAPDVNKYDLGRRDHLLTFLNKKNDIYELHIITF